MKIRGPLCRYARLWDWDGGHVRAEGGGKEGEGGGKLRTARRHQLETMPQGSPDAAVPTRPVNFPPDPRSKAKARIACKTNLLADKKVKNAMSRIDECNCCMRRRKEYAAARTSREVFSF